MRPTVTLRWRLTPGESLAFRRRKREQLRAETRRAWLLTMAVCTVTFLILPTMAWLRPRSKIAFGEAIGWSGCIHLFAFIAVVLVQWVSARGLRAFCALGVQELEVELRPTEARVGSLAYSWRGALKLDLHVDKALFPPVLVVKGQFPHWRKGEPMRFQWHIPITGARLAEIEAFNRKR